MKLQSVGDEAPPLIENGTGTGTVVTRPNEDICYYHMGVTSRPLNQSSPYYQLHHDKI